MKSLLIILIVALTSSFASAQRSGPNGGGGGSKEALVFGPVAYAVATGALQDSDPQIQALGLQLKTTLESPLSLRIFKTIDDKCPAMPRPGLTDFAISCAGEINLKEDFWSNDVSGQQWLRSIAVASAHWDAIVHEVFRAATPGPTTVTNDELGTSTSLLKTSMSVRLSLEQLILKNLPKPIPFPVGVQGKDFKPAGGTGGCGLHIDAYPDHGKLVVTTAIGSYKGTLFDNCGDQPETIEFTNCTPDGKSCSETVNYPWGGKIRYTIQLSGNNSRPLVSLNYYKGYQSFIPVR